MGTSEGKRTREHWRRTPRILCELPATRLGGKGGGGPDSGIADGAGEQETSALGGNRTPVATA